MNYETKFLISLIFTLIIEVPVLIIFVKYIFKEKIKISKIIFIGFLASVLTLPYLWFILPNYINSVYYIYIGELLVLLVEAIIYHQLIKIKFAKALLISFVANLISFLIGMTSF